MNINDFLNSNVDANDFVDNLLEADTKDIEVKNPGILEIPEDKNFWEMPLSHFISLGKKKGKSAVMKALNNLERWFSNSKPELSSHARDIIDGLLDNSEWVEL